MMEEVLDSYCMLKVVPILKSLCISYAPVRGFLILF
jgi:hypothetical protein